MIDQAAVVELIQQQINDAVKHQVTALLEDPAWVEQIEQRALQIVQHRIDQRFANIESDPRLNQSVHDSLKSIINRGIFPDIAAYIGNNRFTQAVDTGVHAAVADVIEQLSLDPAWYAKVEAYINQQMHTKVNKYTAQLDLKTLIKENIDSALVSYFNENKLVRTPGIDDRAEQVELTVMEGIVVAENDLAASNLMIHGSGEIQGSLVAKDLKVYNSIDVTTEAVRMFSDHISSITMQNMEKEWKERLIAQVTESIQKQGMDLSQAKIDGETLIDGDRLASGIRNSNIETVGTLRTLTVSGTTSLTDTLIVHNTRVGINDPNPTMALTVRDRGSVLNAGYLSEGVSYIGTTGDQKLAFGVDGKIGIQIEKDGSALINQIKINGNRINFLPQVPGYAGQKGDIVFNTEPGTGKPFAWVCLNAFQWQAIKGAA